MQRLLVTALVAVAAWRVAEVLPEHVASAPQQRPWSRPPPQRGAAPGVTAPAGGFGARLSSERDAKLTVIPTAGDVRPELLTPAGGDARLRPVIPTAGDGRPELLTPAGGDARLRPVIPTAGDGRLELLTPAGGDARLRPVIPTAGDVKLRFLNPIVGGRKPRPVVPVGGDVRPAAFDAKLRSLTPAGIGRGAGLVAPAGGNAKLSLIAPARPGLVTHTGGDLRPGLVTPAAGDTDFKVLVPAVGGTSLGAVYPGGGDKAVGSVFPEVDNAALLRSEAPAVRRPHLDTSKDTANFGSKTLTRGAPVIGSRSGLPARGVAIPLFGRHPNAADLPRFPALPSTSAEVTVVFPGPAPLLPPPPAFPPPQAFPPTPVFLAPDYDQYDVLQPAGPSLRAPRRKEGDGVLSGIFSHFATKLSGLSSGRGGGLLGFISSLFPKVHDGDDLRNPLALAAEGIKEGAKQGLRLADSELAFQGQQKVEGLANKVERSLQTVGRVGQSQYRALLQKKEAAKDFVAGTAGNVGAYADKATVATFNKVENSLNAVGRLFRDLTTSFLDAMVMKGQAASDLVKDQADTNQEAVGEVLGAKRDALRDSVKAVTDLVAGDRGT